QPPVYTYSIAPILGDGAESWHLAFNPGAALPDDADYATTSYEFPRSLAVNDGAHDPASPYPGVVARAADGLAIAGAIPSQVIFSADLGTRDGFILYVNGTPVLASRLPADIALPAGLTSTDARTGLSPTGLTYQYEVSPTG